MEARSAEVGLAEAVLVGAVVALAEESVVASGTASWGDVSGVGEWDSPVRNACSTIPSSPTTRVQALRNHTKAAVVSALESASAWEVW